ncbi:MAG: hypothetical protein R3C26_01480 [Calditrichia bacterium]
MKKIQRELNDYPEYSIILEDMKMEGTFFKDYFHQYIKLFMRKKPVIRWHISPIKQNGFW